MGSVQSIERLQDIPFHTKIPSLSNNHGGYIVTQILSVAHIKSSTFPDMNSYLRDSNPSKPRKRCLCADVESRQRSAVCNRLYLVRRIKEAKESMDSLEALLSEAFIEYDVNPHLKGKKGIKNYIKFSEKDTARLIEYGIIASNKVSNNLKIYLAEKARCQENPGCDLTTLNSLQKDCHISLDHLEDIDTKFLKFCDIISFFNKFCEPVDDKPIEETSHWTPIFARFWGTLIIYMMHLLPGYALFKTKTFSNKPLEHLEGFYVDESAKKYRIELVQKWDKYREFLGTIATDLKESREVVLRLACKYLMKNFRGDDAKRPHCILDQFILLVDQLKVMRNYFADVLEIVDGCLFNAHQCLTSYLYNPIFEIYFTNIATFFPYCMPNFFTTILSLYGGYISELDLGSSDCLYCRKECTGLIRFTCQECLGDAIYGTYCSRECRLKDEPDHAKICSLRPEDSLRKYKSLFVPMKAKPLRMMNWRDEEKEAKNKVVYKRGEKRIEYAYDEKKKMEDKSIATPTKTPPPPNPTTPIVVPQKTDNTETQSKPKGGYLQRKSQRMQERMAKRKERRQAGNEDKALEKPSDPCKEVEKRHLKILQQRPDLR